MAGSLLVSARIAIRSAGSIRPWPGLRVLPSGMRVADLLKKKGSSVVTLPSTATLGELLDTLDDNKIGAVVVVDDDTVVGIVSERDVVHHLRQGSDSLFDSNSHLPATTSPLDTATITEAHHPDNPHPITNNQEEVGCSYTPYKAQTRSSRSETSAL